MSSRIKNKPGGVDQDTCIPENRIDFWEKLGNADDEVEETDWDEIHIRNFKCSIDTRLRSFYFKIFHKSSNLQIGTARSCKL